ncbi:snurportin-1, partial [Phenoliferia sp. Uapishka_3]
MMSHRDPSHRRSTFHLPTSPGVTSSQTRRRLEALSYQQASRQHAFMSARERTPLSNAMDDMGDLSLHGSSSAEESDGEEQFADAGGESAAVNGKGAKAGKKKAKKYRPWAKNLLMYAETLDLALGLPEKLESEWMGAVVPKGKRCLCSSGFSAGTWSAALFLRHRLV